MNFRIVTSVLRGLNKQMFDWSSYPWENSWHWVDPVFWGDVGKVEDFGAVLCEFSTQERIGDENLKLLINLINYLGYLKEIT